MLVRATKEALKKGIAQVHASARVGDISAAVQKHLELHKLGIVRDLAGHGVGYAVHEEPFIGLRLPVVSGERNRQRRVEPSHVWRRRPPVVRRTDLAGPMETALLRRGATEADDLAISKVERDLGIEGGTGEVGRGIRSGQKIGRAWIIAGNTDDTGSTLQHPGGDKRFLHGRIVGDGHAVRPAIR